MVFVFMTPNPDPLTPPVDRERGMTGGIYTGLYNQGERVTVLG